MEDWPQMTAGGQCFSNKHPYAIARAVATDFPPKTELISQQHFVWVQIHDKTGENKPAYSIKWAHERKTCPSFPSMSNIKHPLRSVLASLSMAKKKVWGSTVKWKNMTSLQYTEKETGYAGFRSWVLLLKSSSPNPGWRKGLERLETQRRKQRNRCCLETAPLQFSWN